MVLTTARALAAPGLHSLNRRLCLKRPPPTDEARMHDTSSSWSEARYSEPPWSSLIAVLAVISLYFVLHSDLIVGPRWLLPVAIVTLLVPIVISHQIGRHDLDRLLGFVVSSLLSVALI